MRICREPLVLPLICNLPMLLASRFLHFGVKCVLGLVQSCDLPACSADTDALFIVLDLDLQSDKCVIKAEVLVVDSDKTIPAYLPGLEKHAGNAVLVIASQRLFFQYPTLCRRARAAKQRIKPPLVRLRSAPSLKPNVPRGEIRFVDANHGIVLDVLDARLDLAFGLRVLDSGGNALDAVVGQEVVEALRKPRDVVDGAVVAHQTRGVVAHDAVGQPSEILER